MSREGATHDVFISHSSEDQAVALAACAALERAGHKCWIAPRDIVPGQSYGEAIVNGIRASRSFLLVVSGRSIASPQVERETERAVAAGLAIIPFRIENVLPSPGLEYFISSAHWLDAIEPPMEQHYDYLVEVVGQLLGEEGNPTLSPPPSPKPQDRVTTPKRRLRLKPALIIAALLVLIAAAGLALWRYVGNSPSRCEHGNYLQRATALDERKPLNLRLRPALEARIVSEIGPGEMFCVGPREGEWWRARRHNGDEGYVLATRVGLFGQSATPAGNTVQPAGNGSAPANGAAPAQENRQ